MADTTHNRQREEVRMEDVVEVGTRISWGAILAGAVMAMAISFVLTLLGQAIGISFSDRTSRDSLGFAAAIWTIVTSVVGLFVGGWITSQCVVGETKTESVVHGIIMWGVAFAMLLWGTASGVRSNFTAMMHVANTAGVIDSAERQNVPSASTAAIPQENADRIVRSGDRSTDDSRARVPASEDARANNDRAAARATWWTLANTILSVIAAVGGALLGAGPTFRLLPVRVTHRHFSARGIPAGSA